MGVFIYLGVNARVPVLGMNFGWLVALTVVLIASALAGGWVLRRATRFS